LEENEGLIRFEEEDLHFAPGAIEVRRQAPPAG
jgi:hypothetical protein